MLTGLPGSFGKVAQAHHRYSDRRGLRLRNPNRTAERGEDLPIWPRICGVVRRISRSRQRVDTGSRKRLLGRDMCSALPTRGSFTVRVKLFLRVDLARIS